MSRAHDESLFEESKMSFGEHLEELRVALFKSLIWLMAGVVVGLSVGNHVVQQIKVPLEAALKNYYLNKTVMEVEKSYGLISDELRSFITTEQVIFDDVFIERNELKRQSKFENSDVATDEELSSPSREMIKTRVWKPISATVKSLSAHEVFMIWLKAAIIAGAIIGSPGIFYQIWNFVAAGLYPHEKNYVYVFLPFSLGLFLVGAALAFFFVFQPVLDFLFGFNQWLNIDPDPRISEWLSFVLFLPLGFGISFQLPLVMLLLNRIGVFPISVYLEKWRIAVLLIFVIAMVVTPADPVSMLLLAIPLTLLYFGGILLCKYMPGRTSSPFGEGYDPS
jgi:sec-independent protein translocase protein TatC